MHYNPDEELASGIEHAAEHKVTKTRPVTICVAQSSLICRTGVSCVPIEDIVFKPYSEATLNDVSLQYDYLIIFPVVKEGKQVREQHASRQSGKCGYR
jgi:hypothetical protein